MVSNSPDTKIKAEAPVRAPSAVPVDDAVLPFEIDALDLRGRLTRLGPPRGAILANPASPADAARPRARRHPDQARLSGRSRQTARRGHRADHAARLVLEIRRPLHPAD